MCDPVTAALVAGTLMQGAAARQRGRFEQGVAEYNARLAENESQLARTRATEEENIQRRKTAELLSRQRTQLAAQGIELGTGSAALLQQDVETLGEMDALRIRETGELQVQSLQSQAALQRSQGDFARQAGDDAFAASLLTAGAQGATGVDSKWFSSKSAAVTTPAGGFTAVDTGNVFREGTGAVSSGGFGRTSVGSFAG